MATVSNVTLQIGREEQGDRRRVTVNYRICFSSCEALAGSTFVEAVTLRGDDPFFDNDLILLRRACVKAQEGCVDRSISTVVSESTLDEDGDTIILGWVISRNRDEIYARVTLIPFTATGSQADSNIVTGQFGSGLIYRLCSAHDRRVRGRSAPLRPPPLGCARHFVLSYTPCFVPYPRGCLYRAMSKPLLFPAHPRTCVEG